MFKPIAARLVQIALFLGTIEWISTALALGAQRSAAGAPATRMLIILLSVAAVCLLSIFVFYSRTLKERFGLDKSEPEETDDQDIPSPTSA